MSVHEYHLIVLYYITIDTAKVASITRSRDPNIHLYTHSKGRQNSLSDITIYFKDSDNGR